MIPTVPEDKALQAPDLRSTIAELKEQQSALQGQIAIARQVVDQARIAVNQSEDDLILGKGDQVDCAAARESLAIKERELAELVAQLARDVAITGRAEKMYAEQQAHRAERDAGELEKEILGELLDFAEQMTSFSRQCSKMENLRARARQLGEQFFSPNLMIALGTSWGEILPAAVESRLELIAKCTVLPEEPNAIVRAAARDRARQAKAEAERVMKTEIDRKRGGKLLVSESIEMKFTEDGRLLARRVEA